MSKHIWAALITSAVLFNSVSPVIARPQISSGYIQPYQGKIFPFDTDPEIDGINQNTDGTPLTPAQEAELDDFIPKVTTGKSSLITGLFVPDYGGFSVVQPAPGEDGIASPLDGVLTQFRRPAANGVTGLLAHNYAAGKWFEKFEIGKLLFVIYGDGSKITYRLTEKVQFQAVDGNSTTTDFIDLANGKVLSVDQVYSQVYTGKPHLTLQTCIQQTDDLTWGRLFLLAEPITP